MSKIIDFLKKNLCFIILLSLFGLVGGYFTGIYSIEMSTPEALEEIVAQVGSIEAVVLITTLQSLLYALALGLIGRAIAERLGIWHSPRLEFRPLISALAVSLFGGSVLILSDIFFFGNFSDAIRDSYQVKPTLNYFIASVTYGGVIEEVMLRLFFMSLIAFILMKLTRKSYPTDGHLIAANIISALLFAAAHLPATVMSIGITPMIIFRCFLINGGVGLLFGRLYRKHGLLYACLGHIGVHIVSKLIWILVI